MKNNPVPALSHLAARPRKNKLLSRVRTLTLKPISLAVLGLLGFAVLYFSWLALRWGGEAQQLLLGNVLYLLVSLTASLVMLLAASKQRGSARRGWLFIGLGFAAQVVGDGVWVHLELISGTEPFPSSADFFYLLMAPLIAAGFFHLLPAPRSRSETLSLGLDLAITVGAAGLYFWRFLLAPSLTWNGGALPTLVTLAYPSLDLLLLGLLALLLLREWGGELPRPEFLLMGLGLAAQVTGDTAYNTFAASYYTGQPLEALWTAAMLLFAFAACSSLIPQRTGVLKMAEFRGYVAVAMPYLAVASGFGLLLVTQADPLVRDTLGGKGVLYGTVLVTLLVVLRQLLAFSENGRLAKHLEQQSSDLRALSETLELKVKERTAELEALSRRFRHDALHDALTGLPNRAHFHRQLQRVVADDQPFAVLYLDFDRFKAVNDSFGHAVGDALLGAIGARLEAHMRPGDTVARLGGDEFAVLLAGISETEIATEIAHRLTQTFQTPLHVAYHTLYCTTSIGVVLGQGPRSSAENVLRDADIAMYQAKALGKSRYALFEPAMHEHIQLRLALEGDLRRAVEREELGVYYQPVVTASSGNVSGFEALARWRHLERGPVSPADFIPLAEETGLIIEIDRWVLKTACAQLRPWLEINPDLTLSVNLSSRQFAQADLASFIAGVLRDTQIAPQHLKLELTESLLMDTSPRVQESLRLLKQLGVRLHIDDFGTGYSSLAYLQRFDADILKIDHSFVSRLLESKDSAELVRTIVNMAHNLGMQVVAEGVESAAQRVKLTALGCDYLQGYLFSRPLPGERVKSLLEPKVVPA